MNLLKFKPTSYKLETVSTGRVFDDPGWALADPECELPSLIRAVYDNSRFTPRVPLRGVDARQTYAQEILRPCDIQVQSLSQVFGAQ